MKGKFIKKLMAYALTAAMVVSTPMTAFASEFADNFWISHGDPEEDEANHGSNPIGTGTVSSTNTDTEVLKDSSKVTGIELKLKGADKNLDLTKALEMNLKDGNQIELEAEVQYSKDAFEGLTDDEVKNAKDQMNKKIAWNSSNLEIIRPRVHYGSRQDCTVTAYKGGIASMTASVDVDNDGSTDFYARVMIIAKKTPTAIKWKISDGFELYANHTYDLTQFVEFGADDEYDIVTFDVTDITPDKKAKLVTWGSDGSMKIGKVKNNDKMTAKITATVKDVKDKDGNDLSASVTVNLTEGRPITKLSFVGDNKKPTYDIADDWTGKTGEWKYKVTGKTLQVTLATKDVRTGATMADTTDDITWSTSDSRIVKITPSEDKTSVSFAGLSAGKATITATATSGKKTSVNVTVTATLKDIEYARVEGGETWTGKTTPITIRRIPTQNNSKLKITIKDKDQKKVVKVKAGINPTIIPVNDIVTKLKHENGVDITDVKIQSANKKDTFKTEVPVEKFTVKQSDVKIKGIAGAVNGTAYTIPSTKSISMNSNRVANFTAQLADGYTPNPSNWADAVSWASSKETVATVNNGRVNVVGDGSAKITASSVYKDGTKYKVSKFAFTIKSTPKCEELVLKAGIVTVKAGKNATVNVKQQLPKKAADIVTWYTFNPNDGTLTEIGSGKDNKAFNKKCTISGSGKSAGSVVTVIARTPSGAEAQAKVIWVQ